MVELLIRLFGIFAIAGVALFCLVDGLNDISKGYITGLPIISRQLPNIVRTDRPASFWIGIGMKLSCAGVAFLFVVTYFAVVFFSH